MKLNSCKVLVDYGIATLVEDATGMKGLLSNSKVEAGQVVTPFYARETLKEPNYLTLQINDQEHILLGPEFIQYTNHSCDPNVFFDTTEMKLVALRDIQVNEELTFFYPSTEWKMDQAFECLCGSEKCIKKIQGAFSLTAQQQQSYKLNQFILNKIQEGAH
ncbi:MAG: hypothetical protein RLY11_492 [Bacteroidota bacterium]